MKVEIWSDVMCPFCYIGKRKFELALEQLPLKDKVEIEWKSFQLSPDLKTNPSKTVTQFLSEEKGVSVEQAQRMNEHVSGVARQVGLQFNFQQAIAANTFNAHRFLHLAKDEGKQTEAEELLFKSFFTDGRNVDDINTLRELGTQLNIGTDHLNAVIEGNNYSEAVQADIEEAREIGITGVPFFVFNRRYAVSGAQPVETFVKTLEVSFDEWKKAGGIEVVSDGEVCEPGGNC